jgi:hypothetical protein
VTVDFSHSPSLWPTQWIIRRSLRTSSERPPALPHALAADIIATLWLRTTREEPAVARIDEIVDGIYRISTTYSDGFDFQFNQFLIDDERPALIHTGMYAMYDDVRDAVAEVLDPASSNT